MGKSSKKNKKSSPSTIEQPDWSSLPEALLTCIFERLLSVRDLFAFVAVCPSWRSIARNHSRRAPFLLRPIGRLDPYRFRWTDPPRCRLDLPIHGSPSDLSSLPSATLTQCCIGYAFGHLIFLRSRTIIIADMCTGSEIRPPNLPFDATRIYTHGFLTVRPSSTVCRLLLTGSGSTLHIWQVGSQEWVRHQLGRFIGSPARILPFRGLLTYGGKLLALDFSGRLVALGFSPQFSLDRWENPQFPPFTNILSTEHLVECGGNLLRIRFPCKKWDMNPKAMEIYRLESSLDETTIASWGSVESLGDWCLFLNVKGGFAMACNDPGRWGGRSNSVYIIGPGCDHWTQIPLQGPPYNYGSPESPFRFGRSFLPRWPAPLWVYPSIMFDN